MFKIHWIALAVAGVCVVPSTQGGVFAESVESYVAGSDVSPAYANPANALGEPARENPGPYGGSIQPFNPPWTSDQLVAIGAGGSLTVRLGTPIQNSASNPFGIDLLIFGNSGFYITNWGSAEGERTDGTLFNPNSGSTRVSVSQDGLNFYTLNPALAPVADNLFPTDASGNYQQPVNPALTYADFAGLSLEQIRDRYTGSAGGTGYDLGWAQDTNGQSVVLQSANYVRIDVLDGKTDIDAFVVVPEPSSWVLLGLAGGLAYLSRRWKR